MITHVILLELAFLFGIGAAVEHDQWFLSATGTIIALGLAWWLLGMPSVVAWTLLNWPIVLGVFAGWFLVGGVTALLKWWRYINREDKIAATKLAIEDWKNDTSHAKSEKFEDYWNNPIQISKHKSLITHWVVFWPAVWFWACTWRLVYNVSKIIYDAIKNTLVAINKSHTDKLNS